MKIAKEHQMTRKHILSLAVATVGAGLLAVSGTASAFGAGPHGRHHGGSGAAKACIAVMTKDQRSDLKAVFTKYGPTLRADHKAVFEAKQALETAIFSDPQHPNLSSAETALASAKSTLQEQEDAAASAVCAILNPKQLSAAQGLYGDLVALRESAHKQAREDFQKARSAAGDPPWNSSSTTQGSPQE
jgi:hypothetical protein